MVCFQRKDPCSGIFWRALEGKMSVHFMPIWYILVFFHVLVEKYGIHAEKKNDRHHVVLAGQKNSESCAFISLYTS
jgi:hypothetical protein